MLFGIDRDSIRYAPVSVLSERSDIGLLMVKNWVVKHPNRISHEVRRR